MKNLLKIIGVLIASIIFLIGCNKDDNIVIDAPDNLEKEILACIDMNDISQDQDTSSQITLVTNKKWSTGRTLRVQFLGGSQFVQEKVEQFAKQWEEYANIKFQFVSGGDTEIRISFAQSGSWSYIGKDALSIPQSEPTMNFGWFDNTTTDAEFRRTTLHEFGHALGAVHEHQHPQNSIQWNKPAVYSYYLNCCGWNTDKVDRNLFDRYSASQTQFSEYDPLSIMHYPISNYFTLDNYSVGWNTDFSQTDICYIRKLYPFPSDRSYHGSGYGVRGGRGWYVGDFNGDGKDDILRYLNENGGAQVALSNGSEFGSISTWSGYGERGGEGWYVGDFNGDGKDDILRYLNSNGGAEVCLSNGNSFGSPQQWSGYGERGGRGWYIGDFNGDGKDDIMRYFNSNGGAEVCLSDGSSFGTVSTWSGYGERGGEGWYIGDYDGDGKDDIIRYINQNGGAEVFLSTGSSFTSTVEDDDC